jgi:hypothetical protein
MADRIACPQCGRVLELPEMVHGQEVRCPQCHNDFVAATPTAITVQAPAPASSVSVQPGMPPIAAAPEPGTLDDIDIRDTLAPSRRYKPPEGPALLAKVALAFTVIAELSVLGSNYLQYNLLQQVARNELVPQADLDGNDVRQMMVGGAHFLFFVIAAIVFMIWFHRVYANLEALGARSLTYTPGWAVGCWFVPILNLFRPVQIAQEIWRKSEPTGAPLVDDDSHTSSLIGLWWAGWIGSNFITQVSLRLGWSARTPQDLVSATMWQMISDIVSCGAAILALVVVHEITSRQTSRAQVLGVAAKSEIA